MGRNYRKELEERGIVLSWRRGRRTEDAPTHKLVDSVARKARMLDRRTPSQRREDEVSDLLAAWRAASEYAKAEFMNRAGLRPDDDHEGRNDV
jgi:hypothetical protein